jgi:hypothetical protein
VAVGHQTHDDRVQVLGVPADEFLKGLALPSLCARHELGVLVDQRAAQHPTRWLGGIGDSFAATRDHVASCEGEQAADRFVERTDAGLR